MNNRDLEEILDAFPSLDVATSEDGERMIVRDTEGLPNANGKWDRVDAVDYCFQRLGPAFVFAQVHVHRHGDDPEKEGEVAGDCEKFGLGPTDDTVLADDLPTDVEELLTALGLPYGAPMAAVDIGDPENSRVAGESTPGNDDEIDFDHENAVEIDFEGDDGE